MKEKCAKRYIIYTTEFICHSLLATRHHYLLWCKNKTNWKDFFLHCHIPETVPLGPISNWIIALSFNCIRACLTMLANSRGIQTKWIGYRGSMRIVSGLHWIWCKFKDFLWMKNKTNKRIKMKMRNRNWIESKKIENDSQEVTKLILFTSTFNKTAI